MSVISLLSPLSNPSLSTLYSYPSSFSHISISPFLNPKFLINPKLHYSSKFIPLHFTTATATKDPDFSVPLEPVKKSDAAIKMPTAPWMKGPLLLEPDEVADLSRARKKKRSKSESEKVDRALTEKVSGVRGAKAMNQIARSISKLQGHRDSEATQENLGGFELGFSLERVGGYEERSIGGKVPWSRADAVIFRREKKEKAATAAESSLDGVLLERLRNEAKGMRRWMKVMKAGVTQAVVDEIHLIWRNNELAMLKFDLPLCLNMDRAREIVEMKTRGLVVWSKKDFLVVYRGCNNRLTSRTSQKMLPDMIRDEGEQESVSAGLSSGSFFEREADRLLDGLGPRFIDWWRSKPLPVDADLLPEVVSGFKPPSRLFPPNARVKLSDDELTNLRKLARPLPTHFVLGRNRKLQGLASAILELWEKCHIVKIAVKWGIPNTDNEQMAYELKRLTGGVLLLRNKFIIIIYRGKDFLPCEVANVIADREMELKACQLHEEAARLKADGNFHPTYEPLANTSTSGTLSEFHNIYGEYGSVQSGNWEADVQVEAKKERLKNEMIKQERKLFILEKKIEKSARVLSKLNSALQPAGRELDQETMTDEERECFRKIGLKLQRCLVLGRRGVFDGVIEGLHQHWKHREVVKVITMQRLFSQVVYTARLLEAESGGILISIEKLKEGNAIFIYRGKNYRRPIKLIRGKLPTKRTALFRSLVMQRIGSLKFFAYQRQREVVELRNQLADLHKNKKLEQRESQKVQSGRELCRIFKP